jgi:hypothetical protein
MKKLGITRSVDASLGQQKVAYRAKNEGRNRVMSAS